jgi:hypothetical protein
MAICSSSKVHLTQHFVDFIGELCLWTFIIHDIRTTGTFPIREYQSMNMAFFENFSPHKIRKYHIIGFGVVCCAELPPGGVLPDNVLLTVILSSWLRGSIFVCM